MHEMLGVWRLDARAEEGEACRVVRVEEAVAGRGEVPRQDRPQQALQLRGAECYLHGIQLKFQKT